MNFIEYFIYIISIVVLISAPGPVMILVASVGIKDGYKKALETIVGTNFASLILITISILILKGLLTVNPIIFICIKIVGCLYIAYLGYGILKEAIWASKNPVIQDLPSQSGGFKKGLLVGISNPKDIIFFSSFFPQFIGIYPTVNISLAILVITWIIVDFLTLSIVYFSFKKISQNKYYSKLIGGCGLTLILIAIYGIYSAIGSI